MKRILIALIFLPLAGFAMEKQEGVPIAISLTRDGEGDTKVFLFSPNGQEVKAEFSAFSRDLKSKYEYTVALSLLNLKIERAVVEGYLSKTQYFKGDNKYVGAFTETLKIDKQEIPVNERNVMEFKYLSDMDVERSKAKAELVIYPVTLGLVILDLSKVKAKL